MAETVATYTIPEHHVIMFTSNVRAALNRKGGVLRPMVTTASYSGEKVQVVNFLGPISFVKRDTRYVDTIVTEPEHTQRWLSGDEYDAAVYIDKLDTLKMIYDPANPYAERMREGAARREDDIIMNAFFAPARAGKQGLTAVPFPSSQIIVNGGTRMSVAKLRAARKLLKKSYVDLGAEMPMIAMTPEQTDDLLAETTVGSHDYNAVKPLVDGEVTSFMGFRFASILDIIPSYVNGSSQLIRQCPCWVQSGMHYGSWEELNVRISDRPDKNYIKQIWMSFTGGATRLEEPKVVQIECLEA